MNRPMVHLLIQIDTRHAASREMIVGVMRFAATHGNIEVQFSGAHPSNAPIEYFRSWKPDALIADASVHALSSHDFASLSGRAVVFVNTSPRKNCRKTFARLTSDDRALAMAAADVLTSKQLRHFAFVGAPNGEPWSVARERFFRAALRDRGFGLSVFTPPKDQDWREQENALAKWLLGLPRPCGVLAAYDQRAKHVLDACRLAGLSVPGQIQVLGVDNEPFICEQTSPSLSSVEPDFEAGGYAATAFISKALSGTSDTSDRNLLFPIRGIVERLSTSDVNGRIRHVSIAREFIRKNATSDITIADIAAATGVSVRLLQKDFSTVTGKTIIDALIDERLARAKNLLKRTATPISEIARLVGYANTTYLMTIFKKRIGTTMSDFRNSVD